jgi:hypothetical protein
MDKQEKDNILDQHKHIYDGYVTKYNQQSNQTPLYVQDLANDKMGLTVNNKGVVKPYSNMNINETHTGSDMIGGDPQSQSNMKYRHLKNGTVDFDNFSDTNLVDNESMNNDYPSPNENEQEYVSYGNFKDEMSQNLDQYEYDIDELEDFSTDGLYSDNDETEDDETEYDETEDDETEDDETEDDEDYNFSDDLDISSVDEENQYDVLSNINESLNMFKKFKNYN